MVTDIRQKKLMSFQTIKKHFSYSREKKWISLQDKGFSLIFKSAFRMTSKQNSYENLLSVLVYKSNSKMLKEWLFFFSSMNEQGARDILKLHLSVWCYLAKMNSVCEISPRKVTTYSILVFFTKLTFCRWIAYMNCRISSRLT